MLFNSLQFFVFFIIVYSLYLALDHKWQNRMLLVASYVFYGAWDWRFLFLIFASTVIDYFCGLKIYRTQDPKKRKLFVSISIISNLSFLGFFKYFNFFTSNLQRLLAYTHIPIDPVFLNVVLPVGISFYTFQTMSYTLDIYRKEMEPTDRFLDFALFVAFFPQLVAGPIERAKRLLGQMIAPRTVTLDKFYEGCYLILWGLFLKIFIADNLASIVDTVFASTDGPFSGMHICLATYAFAFQIFGDFAGYSNIARGLGKCMGFDIMINFNLPYIATNPSEFWRRWHISLSTWLRDYLYIPLGGNRKGEWNTYRNLFLTMLLGGLWHGAAWTFLIWGVYHGTLLMVYRWLKPFREQLFTPKNIFLDRIWFFVRIVFFFQFTCFGWLIFRAHSMRQLYEMTRSLFLNFLPQDYSELGSAGLKFLFYAGILVAVQAVQYWRKDLMAVYKANYWFRTAFYYAVFLLLIFYGAYGKNEFIYFQF